MQFTFKVEMNGVPVEVSELKAMHDKAEAEYMALSKRVAEYSEMMKELIKERQDKERDLIALNVACRQLGVVKTEVQTRFRNDSLTSKKDNAPKRILLES